MSKATKTLAIATIVCGWASMAFAQSPSPYGGGYGPYYSYPGPYDYTVFPGAPYGYANPSYSTPYGTYPAWTYDPDPELSAQMRSDFNRGVYSK
jgi:hypothetical protein